ncbi:MAG: hypothetical protein EOP53_23805 [Sphingobacteriales bacterium]|nr:MAG: hypothetical protein EOP53_23805 [Sphingobacteriales bacterium]
MKKLFLLAGLAGLLASCTNTTNNNSDNNTATDSTTVDSTMVTTETHEQLDTTKMLFTKNGISIAYFEESPDFPEAKLSYIGPDISKPWKEGKNTFQYKVENFELTKQTPGAEHKHCSNSEKGQHIHNILNNEPYTAHYTDTFSKSLKPGHYVNLSFLSRSYHESIKHKNAYVLNQFSVGKSAQKSTFNPKGENLFYSRPKGEYVGKDTTKILLDFYLVNTDLSETGNKVHLVINGTEFMLNKWAPYAIYGLPLGENTIKLELVDKNNKVIAGPFNSVERKITLKAQ